MESLFIGPENKLLFGEENPHFVPEPSRWNRKLYYSTENPNLIPDSFMEYISKNYGYKVNVAEILEHLSKNLNHKLEGTPGIWSIWGYDGYDYNGFHQNCDRNCIDNNSMICLDVHETLDIGYEIRMHQKDLEKVKNLPWNDETFSYNGNLFSLEKRSKAISQWKNLEYRLVLISNDDFCKNASKYLSNSMQDDSIMGLGKFLRELVEAQYAWNFKAVYWNRNYFQAINAAMKKKQMNNEYIMSRK